jgi:predicted DNA-binding antitoxin AbrB/MazE fold protein
VEFRGIFEEGVVRPIEPVDLPDGTEVEFRARLRTPVKQDDIDGRSGEFWRARSLDELAAEQGVRPIKSIDELAARWPDDDPADSVDEFIRHLREWRK